MKVLVIGSGGREHAICWKVRQSSRLKDLYCAPGNPGIARIAENIPIQVHEIEKLVEFAKEREVDLTIVGPEYPLTLGVADAFQKAGCRLFGPSAAAARIEGSKSFAKNVMARAGVPCAKGETFTEKGAALSYVEEIGAPIVLKADGLAAGKGVFVCADLSEARSAVEKLFSGEFSDAPGGSTRVVVEECLTGREASYIIATNGKEIVPLASSHDYKRIFDGDKGPNTGGMGTLSPTPHLSPDQEGWVLRHVMEPVIREMEALGNPYLGFLYAGLMIGDDGRIHVLEFNARLGDPETQVIMRRMKSDLLEVLWNLTEPGAPISEVSWDPRAAVCVVLAAAGYPGEVRKGDVIEGVDRAEEHPDCVVFHAGTSLDPHGKLIASGGRVLNVTGLGSSLQSAREFVYERVKQIQFSGMQFRSDIGAGR